MQCEIFKTDSTYLKEMPPEPKGEVGKTDVFLKVDVLSIVDISEVDNFISLQLRLKLSWTDPRLTMFNLNDAADMNTLTMEARQKIWIPQVIFHNTQHKEESLNDEKAIVTIDRQGPFIVPPKSLIHNAYVFEGSQNQIGIERIYSFKFSCDFYMGVYPFDTQKCSAIFVLKSNSGKFARLNIDEMSYMGPIDLTQYFVEDTNISYVEIPGNQTGVQVDLVFGRRILSTILTTYLPTSLICIVSFATNYFKGFFFEAIVTVNLTSLLVLTTLFISVSNSLPQTAYLKMIDIWLIFNLFIPFCETLLQTMIENLKDQDEVNHHGMSLKVNKKNLNQQVDKEDNKNELKMFTNGKMVKIGPQIQHLHMTREPGLALNRGTDHHAHKMRNRKLRFTQMIANRGLPTVFILFSLFYFTVGFLYYKRIISSLKTI